MSEHIISDRCLDYIRARSYEAGQRGQEVYTVRGADGEEVVRCRDCENAFEEYNVGLSEMELCPDGKLDCLHFSQWDYYSDIPGHFFVEPNGYCAWGRRREL